MEQKLIITKKDSCIISAVYDQNDMIKVNLEKDQNDGLLGNMYIAKVKNIIRNIKAAFVEIEGGRMCYISLDECRTPIFLNSKKTGSVVSGDTLVVQIAREDMKTKLPMAVTSISFTGKYAVLSHGKPKLGVSAKIRDEEERERLKHILKKYQNDAFGLVIRTNAEGVEQEKIEHEIHVLKALYDNLLTFGIHKTVFSCIYRAPKGYLSEIRDEYSESLEKIMTDDRQIYDSIQDYLNCYQPEDLAKLTFYDDPLLSLSKLYSIETKLNQALKRQVWLKSGGSIIIEPTEALTVIDVNTGKAIRGKKKVQETFFKINQEAAKEAAKQIRLRNLSGIIVIDFIDMDREEDREELLETMRVFLKQDPVKTVLVDMTPLGLVEITRKKSRKPLYEQVREAGKPGQEGA